MPKLGAIQYAYWNAVKGTDFKYYEPIDVKTGKFMGELLGYERHLNEFLQKKESWQGKWLRKWRAISGTEKRFQKNGFYERQFDELYRKAKENYTT